MLIFIAMMATAFMGYSLVWGQMSLWAVTVITNFFQSFDSIIPGWGTALVEWIRGDFSVSNVSLNRLYSLHYLVPFVLAALVGLHIWALHVPGNNNPTGVEVKDTATETLPFHPYYTVKDAFTLSRCSRSCSSSSCSSCRTTSTTRTTTSRPTRCSTPQHIAPEWYFLPFYAILNAIPSKLGGVIAMFGSLVVLFFAPWLDRSRVRSARLPADVQVVLLAAVYQRLSRWGSLGRNRLRAAICWFRASSPSITSFTSWSLCRSWD